MLQPAMLSDLNEVAFWISSARDCQFWAGDRVRFPIDLHSLPDELNFRAGNAYSLYEGARLMGFGQLIPKASHRGHLATLIVSPASRRKGYGTMLVNALLAKARRAQFQRASLYVDKANQAAIGLYTRFGFRSMPPPALDPVLPASQYMERSLSEEASAGALSRHTPIA